MPEIDETPILDPPYKELVKVASNWGYGTRHSHAEIGLIMHLNYFDNNKAYNHNLQAAKPELEDMGKRLQSIHGWGYRVLEANEHVSRAAIAIQQKVNLTRKELNRLVKAPINDMDDMYQKRTIAVIENTSALVSKSVAASYDIGLIADTIRKKPNLLSKAKTSGSEL